MDVFSISDLQEFSGIKAHTIRIWEQRYHALTPSRSKGNTRSYDNSQLRRLLNIVSLMNQDYKISELCSMPDKDIFRLLEAKLNNVNKNFDQYENYISQMILSSISFNELNFEKLFSGCVLRYGMKDTYLKVIYPVINRLGVMWRSNTITPAQEHYITNLIRQKILTTTDALPVTTTSKKTWLLFLPENEFHEIGLLFAQYILKQNNVRVIYLGSNVPLESLEHAVLKANPSDLYFFLVHNSTSEAIGNYVSTLSKKFKNIRMHITLNEMLRDKVKFGKEVHIISSITELEQVIN